MDRTRRGLLGLLAATTGCLGFGGGNEVTPGQVTDSPAATRSPTPTEEPTATATETPTATASETPTATASESPTVSPTPTATPTATARDAQAPPQGSLQLIRRSVSVFPSNPPSAQVFATLRHTGDVDFSFVELRFDLSYQSPFGGDSELVAVGYFHRAFGDQPFTGGTATVGGELSLAETGLSGDEPTDRFSLDFAFRRVRFR